MKRVIVNCLFAAAAVFTIGTANAAPIQPLAKINTADVIEVRALCGAGYHRGPAGACVPNVPRYVARPYYAYPAPYYRCWWQPGPWGPVRVCAY